MSTKTNGTTKAVPKLDQRIFERIASTLEPREAEWLWWPWFPMGAVSVLASAGNVGKGLMLADIAARVTRGDRLPMTEEHTALGNVIWAEAEDDDRITLVPRLTAAKADMERVAIMDTDEFSAKITNEVIRKQKIRLIVLSPLISFAGIGNPNAEVEVREKLEKMLSLVEGTRCAIVGIMHPNKKTDIAAIERILGSVAFANFCRSVVLLKAEEDDTVRVMHSKWNWSTKGNDLLFTKRNTRAKSSPRGQFIAISWEQADENQDQNNAFVRQQAEVEGVESAGEWLVKYLERKGGRAPCGEIFRDAEKSAHTSDALKQAKKRNPRITHHCRGFGREHTVWVLGV